MAWCPCRRWHSSPSIGRKRRMTGKPASSRRTPHRRCRLGRRGWPCCKRAPSHCTARSTRRARRCPSPCSKPAWHPSTCWRWWPSIARRRRRPDRPAWRRRTRRRRRRRGRRAWTCCTPASFHCTEHWRCRARRWRFRCRKPGWRPCTCWHWWPSTGRTNRTTDRRASRRDTARRSCRRRTRAWRRCRLASSPSSRHCRGSARRCRCSCSRRAWSPYRHWHWSPSIDRRHRTTDKPAWRRRTRRRRCRRGRRAWPCYTPASFPRTARSRCTARTFPSSCSRPASPPCILPCSSPSTDRKHPRADRRASRRRTHRRRRRRGRRAWRCCILASYPRTARSRCTARTFPSSCSRPAWRPCTSPCSWPSTDRTRPTPDRPGPRPDTAHRSCRRRKRAWCRCRSASSPSNPRWRGNSRRRRPPCSRRGSRRCTRWHSWPSTDRTRPTPGKPVSSRRTHRRRCKPGRRGWPCCTPGSFPRTARSTRTGRTFPSSCNRPAWRPCKPWHCFPSTDRRRPTPGRPAWRHRTRRRRCMPGRRAWSCCTPASSLRIARWKCTAHTFPSSCSRPASPPSRPWHWSPSIDRRRPTPGRPAWSRRTRCRRCRPGRCA